MDTKGYDQAVHNLAYYIIKYADRDFEPIKEDFTDDTAKMIQHIEDHPELQEDWNGLEEAADAIATTYNVTYPDLMADVWKTMIAIDPRTNINWN